MKNLKMLDIKVTYKVGLSELKVPNKVYEQLQMAYEMGDEINTSNLDKYNDAYEWILKNIKEKDSYEWMYESEFISLSK